MNEIEKIDSRSIHISETDISEKMSAMNRNFNTKLTPENGIFGVTETDKGNGLTERAGKNEFGHTIKEYFQDGKITMRREVIAPKQIATTYFDDIGTAYLRSITRLDKNQNQVQSQKLIPNITVTKDNFTAVIDELGRPVSNKIHNLSIRPLSESRRTISAERDESYKTDDQKGHLIADSFYGPGTRENIVPQLDKVNQSKMAQVENIVRSLKEKGHIVDYEVRANYIGSDMRSSSFEPHITADGIEYADIPDNLKKIYNDDSESAVTHALIDVKEKYSTAHNEGIHAGIEAVGTAFIVSAVNNITDCISGVITPETMAVNIVKDTAGTGILEYGKTFISTTVSEKMQESANTLIKAIGDSGISMAAITFIGESCQDLIQFSQGKIDSEDLIFDLIENAADIVLPNYVAHCAIDSCHDILDFLQGDIEGDELAYNIVGNAVTMTGGIVGAALGEQIGGTVGKLAGPVGTSIGTVAGSIVGGAIGCVVATEAYATAVELVSDGVEYLADKAVECANTAIQAVSDFAPEALDTVKNAFHDFLGKAGIPINV